MENTRQHFEANGPPRILIVDDNPSIHRDFELVLLESWHDPELDADERRVYGARGERRVPRPAYRVDHALSGLEGVDKIKQSLIENRPYQLAFVDIRMPGIDGVETIELIWRVDSQVQIVICTAFADYSWDDLAGRLGPTDNLLVLKKPFDNIEVTQLASTLSEKWHLARQAAMKLEQRELLIGQRTQKLLELQRIRAGEPEKLHAPSHTQNGASFEKELPVILVTGQDGEPRGRMAGGFGLEYRVIEAADNKQALEQARQMVPDLIISEITPPRTDGLELCRSLKADELASHIPVIVVTTDVSEKLQIQALEAGADDYLIRPFTQTLLRARAENLLRSRRMLHEHFNHELALQPREVAATQADAHFLRRAIQTVEKHLPDFEFDVDLLAQRLALSRRQLFRKLKAVTGCTPHAFIRALRLKRAAQLLKQSALTVTEITYAVGFSDLKHFRTVFREQFGVLPGEYAAHSNGAEQMPDPRPTAADLPSKALL